MRPVKRAYVDILEGQMHYRFCGQGEALVLMHIVASSSDEYEAVGDRLGTEFRVFAPDFLGYGESDPAPSTYSIHDHARSIIAFLDALGIAKAIVGGHHVGATVALKLASEWPDRISALILSNLPYDSDYQAFRRTREIPLFETVKPREDGGHLLTWWQRAAQYGDPVEFVSQRALCFHKAGQRGEELHWAIFEDTDLNAVLPRVFHRTLVIAAEKDFLAPAQTEVARRMPNAELRSIPEGPVYVTRRMPDAFAQVILNFFGDRACRLSESSDSQ